MSTTLLITIGVAIISVAFLMFSLAITYIRKGHHIEGEIGDNPHMKARGINCTSRQIIIEENEIFGRNTDPSAFCGGTCGECENHCTDQEKSDHTSENPAAQGCC